MAKKRRFLLRLDPDIYDAIQRWAADEWRSVNGQIEFLLREALRRGGRLPGGPRRVHARGVEAAQGEAAQEEDEQKDGMRK